MSGEFLSTISAGAATALAGLVFIMRNPAKRAKFIAPLASALTGGSVASLEGMRTTVDALTLAVNGLTSTVRSQGESLLEAQSRMEILEKKVTDREATIAQLEIELENTQLQLLSARHNASELRVKVDRLTDELNALKSHGEE
jgi:predicted  nucleic acid-binding Zn-ribbon protein